MRLNAERLIEKARRHLLDTASVQQGTTWQDTDILEAINDEQGDLVAEIIDSAEDWLGAVKDLDVTAGDGTYDLFEGFLKLRYLELGGDGSAGSSFYNAIESRMIEGVSGPTGSILPTDSPFWYALWDEELHIQPFPSSTATKFGRMWFIRMPGPVILELAASAPAADKVRFPLTGRTPVEDDIMEGTHCDVVAGTGAGQRRKIIAWDGDTREATFNAAFSPALDATSKIATVSRVPMLFHPLLSMGAALRLMVDLKEDGRGLKVLYDTKHEKFVDFVDKRTDAQRGIVPYDLDDPY